MSAPESVIVRRDYAVERGIRRPSVPLLFRLMELLDFSVDALVFPEREPSKVLHIDHLTDAQAEALERFIDTLK